MIWGRKFANMERAVAHHNNGTSSILLFWEFSFEQTNKLNKLLLLHWFTISSFFSLSFFFFT
jgi:hypothetical protein